MNKKEEIKLSKFLSFVLRHGPDDINLEVDKNGWANIEELIEKSRSVHAFSREEIEQVVINNSKQRFIFSEDKKRIKANQGHSIQVELGLPDTKPPQYLYHGTAQQYVDAILKDGIKPMSRHDVHLSFNMEIAYHVGIRHGVAVILRVNAIDMFQAGMAFQCTANNVWLTQHVPAQFIEIIPYEKKMSLLKK